MVKGIAIVLIRLMGLFFLFQALLQAVNIFPMYWQNSNYIDYSGYWSPVGPLIAGLFLLFFSVQIARTIAPSRDMGQAPISFEETVMVGLFLLGCYFIATGIALVIPEATYYLMKLFGVIQRLAQDHNEGFLQNWTSLQSYNTYIWPWVNGIAKIVIGMILIFNNGRLARKVSRQTS